MPSSCENSSDNQGSQIIATEAPNSGACAGVVCRPGMVPVPLGSSCRCMVASSVEEAILEIPIGQATPGAYARVPGHPQVHPVTPTTQRPRVRPPPRGRPRPRSRPPNRG